MISISHIPCYHGNIVVLAARVKPVNKQHPRLLSASSTKYDTRRALHGQSYKHMSLLPWLQHFNIDK